MTPARIAPAASALETVRRLVLDAVRSPLTRAMYGKALDDFFAWWEQEGRPPFVRATIQAHLAFLQSRGYRPSTLNQRLAAIRKLAREAAANGLLAADLAAGIQQVPGAKQSGHRAGNWLTREQAQSLLNLPDLRTAKGRRDQALLALLLGCGLRRAEAAHLTLQDVQQREGRWVIVDLQGKHGRVRTVPVPSWVKAAIDHWVETAGITEGRILRAVNRQGLLGSDSLTPQSVRSVVAEYGARLGLRLQAHDARRTCAKLCRAAGGDLEQIQLLLGHASIQTTERYLGTRQNLAEAVNDRLGLIRPEPPAHSS